MKFEYRWVIAYDKETGERVHFTTCPKNNALFYREKYLIDGYDARILTDEEVDEIIASEKKKSPSLQHKPLRTESVEDTPAIR